MLTGWRLICEMSRRVAIPPSVLQHRFSAQDITHLIALQNVEREETGKEDFRLSYLLKNLERIHQMKSKNDYLIDWKYKEEEYKTAYEKGMEEKAKWYAQT